jgi:hypothetical protein
LKIEKLEKKSNTSSCPLYAGIRIPALKNILGGDDKIVYDEHIQKTSPNQRQGAKTRKVQRDNLSVFAPSRFNNKKSPTFIGITNFLCHTSQRLVLRSPPLFSYRGEEGKLGSTLNHKKIPACAGNTTFVASNGMNKNLVPLCLDGLKPRRWPATLSASKKRSQLAGLSALKKPNSTNELYKTFNLSYIPPPKSIDTTYYLT